MELAEKEETDDKGESGTSSITNVESVRLMKKEIDPATSSGDCSSPLPKRTKPSNF